MPARGEFTCDTEDLTYKWEVVSWIDNARHYRQVLRSSNRSIIGDNVESARFLVTDRDNPDMGRYLGVYGPFETIDTINELLAAYFCVYEYKLADLSE